MVCVLPHSALNVLSIDEVTIPADWEVSRSRLLVTDEEKRNIAEYHRKIKEQQDKGGNR